MIKRLLRGLSFGLVRRVPIFKLKVVYKSGATHTFEVREFTVKGGSWSWDSYDQTNKPIVFGVDDIAAVWQVGVRHVVQFGRKKGA